MPRCIVFCTLFFDRFLVHFCSHFGPPNLEKSSSRCRESTIYQKSPFEVNIEVCSDLGTKILPLFSSKIYINVALKHDFLKALFLLLGTCIDLFTRLARYWKPPWRHVGHNFVRNGGTEPRTLPHSVRYTLFFNSLAKVAASWQKLCFFY